MVTNLDIRNFKMLFEAAIRFSFADLNKEQLIEAINFLAKKDLTTQNLDQDHIADLQQIQERIEDHRLHEYLGRENNDNSQKFQQFNNRQRLTIFKQAIKDTIRGL